MTPEILERLRQLRMRYLSSHYDEFIKTSIKQRFGPTEVIESLVKHELEERRAHSTATRLAKAKIGKLKPMVDFDWNWPKAIPRSRIEQLLKLEFIDEPINVVLVSTAGLGKTMIAKNMAYEAAIAGYDVIFIEAAELIADLQQQDSPSGFRRRLKHYTKPALLVIDELGYLSYNIESADLLFQVINRRHENCATVVTTNKSFKDWGEIFPGAGCVVALIDRLTHHAEIIPIEGDSYRRREAKDAKKQKKGAKT